MDQHPRVTVAWAVASLERAIGALGASPAENRTRRQFHQLLLALERDGYVYLDAAPGPVAAGPARVLPLSTRPGPSGRALNCTEPVR